MKIYLYLFILIFFVACEEKTVPKVTVDSKLQLPITCMKLNDLGDEERLLNSLNKLYPFTDDCPLTLTLSSKKDIVCNSTNNIMSKNMGKFPRSFLKLELRQGMGLKYSYYIDLYSNVDEDDVENGFERLKEDLIKPKGTE